MRLFASARLAPTADLLPSLVALLDAEDGGYSSIPGAGGTLAEDAGYCMRFFSAELIRTEVPALLAALARAASFGTMPLVSTLVGAVFEPREEAVETLNDIQREVLAGMVATEDMWVIGNLSSLMRSYGLRLDRAAMAELANATYREDKALQALSTAITFGRMRFWDKAGERLDEALDLDASVMDRSLEPAVAWLIRAQVAAHRGNSSAAAEWLAIARALEPNLTFEHGSPLGQLQ